MGLFSMNNKLVKWIVGNPLYSAIIAVASMWLINLGVGFVKPLDKAGTFGDQFGAVNALFSGLAFAGLIYTILQQKQSLEKQNNSIQQQAESLEEQRKSIELQREDLQNQQEELRLNRQELELTREEMKNQTAEFEKQNESLKIQRFENTFFNMMSLLQEIVNSLSVSYTEINKNQFVSASIDFNEITVREVKGREVFKFLFNDHGVVIGVETMTGLHEMSSKGMRGVLKESKWEGYLGSEYPEYFDHYFRHLYRILKFIDESPLVSSYESKYEYAAMLRAQLSRYELVWLYYNSLSDYGRDKFKPLIERYAMLKNLRKDLLVEGFCSCEYSEGAYCKSF